MFASRLRNGMVGIEEAVHQFRQGRAVALPARRAAGVKVFPLFLEESEGLLPVFPRPEVMQLSPDLFAPLTVAMRGEGESLVALRWLVIRGAGRCSSYKIVYD